jgi:hypothetical protein
MNFIKDIINNLKFLLGGGRLDESLSKEIFVKGLNGDTSNKIDYKNLIVTNNMIEHVYPSEPRPNPNQSVVEVGLDYNISPHLTYGQCVSTQHRDQIRKNFDEGKQFLHNMKFWANTIYEPIIEILGIVPTIDSMFRCSFLNTIVGGSLTSQHMDAEAGDTKYEKMSLRKVYNKLAWSKIPFSQIIIEFESWIHIGSIDLIKHSGKVGQRFITGKDKTGNTIYIPVIKPFKI